MNRIYTLKELNRLSKYELATLIVARSRKLAYNCYLREELGDSGLEFILDLSQQASKAALLRLAKKYNKK